MPRRSRPLLAVATAALVLVAAPAGAQAEDVVVTSFDGTPIVAHVFPAPATADGSRAPTVLVGAGWAGTGETNVDSPELTPLRAAGYNLVTWAPRGFGASGGTVQIDDPRVEGRDVSALIDYVAAQPWAQLDRPGDPRLGMAGGSYGGGIQYATAGRDHRVDALVPIVGWHSLVTSLYKDRTFKQGWDGLLFAAGSLAAGPDGLDPHIGAAYQEGLTSGRLSAADEAWFAARGPGDVLLEKITAPTLVVGGTIDTLFPLDEDIKIYDALRRAGTTVKMMWFCGGHGECLTGTGDPVGAGDPKLLPRSPRHLTARTVAWFARYLKGDRMADVGPGFEWLADDARWRSAKRWPVAAGRPVRADGHGRVVLRPGYQSGEAVRATPAPAKLDLSVPMVARRAGQWIGAPRVTLRYVGTGAPADARVYAQIVDVKRKLVVGNQVTPIPVRLDGRRHTVSRPLTPIAVSARRGGRYTLQIIASSKIWMPQRATGTVRVSRATITIPTRR